MRFLSGGIVFAVLLVVLATTSSGQEIRRAVPVEPSVPPIRRAIPVQPLPSPTATATPLAPLAPASVNDTARFLAGLPVAPDSSLVALTRDPAWQKHVSYLNQAWLRLTNIQFVGIRDLQAAFMPETTQPLSVAFYMFSGPDFLYANQFYPNASTYILAGTEPVGALPDATHLHNSLDTALHGMQTALNSVLRFSFFITEDMKSDLQLQEFKGVLPLFYVFLARADKSITDITFLSLDDKGNPRISDEKTRSRLFTQGVRITFRSNAGGAPQTLYYFTTDLSDDGIRARPGFMTFCAQQGIGDSLLKSASYLMFESGFAVVRNFLLTHSQVIIQDDSGIPMSAFVSDKWNLRFFGNYSGPIDTFKQYYQPALKTLFDNSHPAPLHFGIGYRWRRSESSLIVAAHK